MEQEPRAGQGLAGERPGPADVSARRPENRRLRELVDETLAVVRAAAARELWTPEERASSTEKIEELLVETMGRLRREVMEPGSAEPAPERMWRAPRPVFTRASLHGADRERRTKQRLRLRRELDALLEAIRVCANPVHGRRGRWNGDAERGAFERQLDRLMAAVRAEAMGE